jgi:hypothetical protein
MSGGPGEETPVVSTLPTLGTILRNLDLSLATSVSLMALGNCAPGRPKSPSEVLAGRHSEPHPPHRPLSLTPQEPF